MNFGKGRHTRTAMTPCRPQGSGTSLSRKATGYGILAIVTLVALSIPTHSAEIIGWGTRKLANRKLTHVCSIAAGWRHSLALKSDGTIIGWGENYYGQATPPAGNDYVAIAAAGNPFGSDLSRIREMLDRKCL